MVANPAADVVVPPRPLRVHARAATILGERTLRERGIAPFDLGDTTISLATGDPDLAAVARFVQRDHRYAAQVGWEVPELVEQALTAFFAPQALPTLIDRQTEEWRRALSATPSDASHADSGHDRLDALALVADLPSVRLERWRPDPALARLLPEPFARANGVLPILYLGGVLYVATGGVPDVHLARELDKLVDTAYQWVLVEAAPLVAALERAYAEPAAGAAADPASLRTIARTTGLPIADLARERVDPRAAALLPRAVCERLGVLVVSVDARRARALLSSDTPHADAALLQALLHRPVDVALTDRAALLERIAAEYPAAAPPTTAPRLWEYLAGARPELASALPGRSGTLSASSPAELTALLAGGILTMDEIAEAKGLQTGLPWLPLRHIEPEQNALAALPADTARDLAALPLRRVGDVLHVAVATLDHLPAIERASRCTVRPVIAERADLAHAIERLYDARRREAPELEALLDQIAREGGLTAAQRDDVLAAHTIAGTPVDVALVQAGVGTQPEVAALLAGWAGAPQIDVRLRERHDQVISALGAFGPQRRSIDPVDASAAALLPAAIAQRLCVLPVRGGGVVALAVADPLDREGIAEAAAAIGRPVVIAVSPRGGLTAAIRRSYGQRNLGDHLVEAGLVSPEELVRAIALHDRTGVRLGKALLTMGYVTQEQLTAVLADQLSLPYFDVAPEKVDPEIAQLIPEEVCRWRGVLPLAVEPDGALLAMTDPLDTAAIDEAQLYLEMPIQPVLITERQFDAAMETLYRDSYLVHSAADLLTRAPDDSAYRVLSRGQKITFSIGGLAILLGLVLNLSLTLGVLISFACLFYFAFSAYKLYLIYKSLARSLEVVVTPEEIAALDDRDVPLYSVLVPMYREGEVLPILVEALDRLDYPKTKLEVLLLLEEDDRETVEAAQRMRLPEGFRILVVPHGQPKGKPKACNYGLLHARGEFVVLYDAEDVPEPDQLKKALIAFRRGGDDVVTVQAKLNYFNRDQNLLTRWFTSEYAMWFDLLLPGLDNSGAPIPLGGTSNHFRAAALRALGGWDPFNVTEDADLGIRLFKRGYRTCVVNSTTYEEANSRLGNWIRQRSRWIKGYMQTWLVHMRHPLRLWRDIGTYPFLSLQMIILGTFFAFLLNPVFWGLTALWFLTHWGFIQSIFPGPVFYLGTVAFYFGNFAFLYINVAGALRREYHHLVKYLLLTPIYWALMSIAAWKALYQLIFRPSYWEKTAHGLYRGKVKLPAKVR